MEEISDFEVFMTQNKVYKQFDRIYILDGEFLLGEIYGFQGFVCIGLGVFYGGVLSILDTLPVRAYLKLEEWNTVSNEF